MSTAVESPTFRAVPETTREVSPGPRDRSIRTTGGDVLDVPDGWELLPPGDAGLTRRVKKAGASWTVKEKVGRRMFSRGVWAPAGAIAAARADLEHERADPSYTRKLEAGRARRVKEQTKYAEDFEQQVQEFLRFANLHRGLESRLARAISDHAVPVGSGTVARTARIPIERRAESATIAWLRHATTAYDHMTLARIKGERRAVRRMLAAESRKLLDRYRRGDPIPPTQCPLHRGLAGGDVL
ncbi:MAG: DUF2293 domain-containing protein [Candidatus Binatia bacterium]|nr:DUF2293 domain-containing protein [Candidatus Binatia bacterium]